MSLTFRRPRTNGTPANQVGNVLRAQQVEKFGRGGQPERVDVEQQLPRSPQPFIDAEAAVQARVVDVSIPTDRRARLLEVDAHHHAKVVSKALAHGRQPACVLETGLGIVDRARSHDQHLSLIHI